MTISIVQTGLNLATAVGLGAAIGFERQWRNRLAGLRTNTLVAKTCVRVEFDASTTLGSTDLARTLLWP